MDIAKISVERPVATWMRILIFMLLGAIAFTQLPIELLPSVNRPAIYITTTWPGVSPEDLETQITSPIEDAVATVPGMVNLSSQTSEGNSRVTVEFGPGQDMSQAALDVLQQVQSAQRSFPTEDPTLQAPNIRSFDPTSIPILVLGVTGIEDGVRLRTVLEEEVKPILESARGVGSVEVNGGLERAVMVEFDPQALLAHSLTSQDIVRALASENRNVPAGTTFVGNKELLVRSYGWFQDVDEIRHVPLKTPRGDSIPLSAVATVTDSHRDLSSVRRLDGIPAGGLDIQKQAAANTVDTAAAVLAKLEEVQRARPELRFEVIYNQAAYVSRNVFALQEAALLGGLLAMAVVFFFLRNFRTTLVVATSIPVSIISTFSFLWWQGYSLNTMSLVGLAIATGMIVDDAVVVMESIYRRIEKQGLSPKEAAVEGTRPVISAVITSTLTVIVVFFPLLLIPGQTGQMFRPFALVVIVSLLFSSFDALTAVPMLSSTYIKPPEPEGKAPPTVSYWDRQFETWGGWFDQMDEVYRKALEWAISRREFPLKLAGAVTLGSLLLTPFIGYQFMPRSDTGIIRFILSMPEGTSLEETDRTMAEVEKILGEHPGVAHYLVSVGTGLGRRPGGRDRGQGWIALVDERRRASANQIGAELNAKFRDIPAARVRTFVMDVVSWLIRGRSGGDGIELNLFGPSLSRLEELSNEVSPVLAEIPGMEDVRNDDGETSPEIRWVIDRAKATKMGLSFSEISAAIQTASGGTVASYLQADGRRAPIVVQLPQSERRSTTQVRNLILNSRYSETVSGPGRSARAARGILLRQVAEPVTATGFPTINRQSRQRYTALVSDGKGRAASEIQADVERALAEFDFPDGYRWDWSQEMKSEGNEFRKLAFAGVLAVLLVYMLLCIQFEDLIVPLSIMLTVPLCVSGVLMAVFLTNTPFSIMAGVGSLLLIGIAVKNGILLIERTLQARDTGMAREQALLEACPERLRPVLITALSAILAMVPVALKGELEAPLAIAVIGGLLASTLMTLLVVPLAYLVLDDLRQGVRKERA